MSRSFRRQQFVRTVAVAIGATTIAAGVLGVGGSVAVAAPAPTMARILDPIAERASDALALVDVDTAQRALTSPAYQAIRAELARRVGWRLLIEPRVLERAWAAADAEHQIALMAALAQLGTPYRRRSADPLVGFDCSGLTAFAWGVAGHALPRNSTAQLRVGEPRTVLDAQAGDLLRYPGHVMMWLGVGQAIVHSPEPGRAVEVKTLSDRSFERSLFFDPS